MPSNHLILYCPLLLLPSILPSIRVHSKESALPNRWSKYWTFSFSICPSNEYSVPISFTIDWVDLLAVQGTLESLLHHYISEASIIWHSPFFIVQLSHPIMTPGKTMALTRWTFVDKIMSVLFNKCLSWSLSDLTFTFHFHALEKEMASHSSVCLEHPRDGGAWWAAIYGDPQSQTRLKRQQQQQQQRQVGHNFSSKEEGSFNFMAAVNICSNF